MRKKIIYILSLVSIIIFVIVVVPISINEFIINNNVYSKASNDSWVAFLGSYLGGILGGLATLMGVLITLKVTRMESIKPVIVVDLFEEVKPIHNPSYYNENNTINRIMNYYDLPILVDIFGMRLMNTGKGSAREIKIVFSISKSDVLITDDNRLWLSLISPLNQIEESDEEYIQAYRYSFLGSEGETKQLPLNLSLNGLVISSLWNIANFILFTEDDFLKSIDHYKEKVRNKPLTIPNINVKLEYQDIDNNCYVATYTIAFDYIYQQLGSYNAIKPRIEFHTIKRVNQRAYRKIIKKSRSESKTNLSKNAKNILRLKELWHEEVLSFGQFCGFEETISEIISTDEALERYFFNAFNLGKVEVDDLAYKIAFIYLCESGELLKFDEEVVSGILRLIYSLLDTLGPIKKNKVLENIDLGHSSIEYYLEKINNITTNKTSLFKYYFKSYEVMSDHEVIIKVIEDGSNPFITEVNIGNEKLKTELGFFRGGFTYIVVTEEESLTIQSVAKRTTENSEFGFLDYSGYIIGEEVEWDCTYLR